jgi:hypothetical protein
MAYTSNYSAVAGAFEDARKQALIAAATVLINDVKRGLRGGYTSGAFVTGNVIGSVTRDEPLVTATEGVVRVGTNVPYALYWELGHHNAFTRKYARKEVWMPALSAAAARMQDAYARTMRRLLGGA